MGMDISAGDKLQFCIFSKPTGLLTSWPIVNEASLLPTTAKKSLHDAFVYARQLLISVPVLYDSFFNCRSSIKINPFTSPVDWWLKYWQLQQQRRSLSSRSFSVRNSCETFERSFHKDPLTGYQRGNEMKCFQELEFRICPGTTGRSTEENYCENLEENLHTRKIIWEVSPNIAATEYKKSTKKM